MSVHVKWILRLAVVLLPLILYFQIPSLPPMARYQQGRPVVSFNLKPTDDEPCGKNGELSKVYYPSGDMTIPLQLCLHPLGEVVSDTWRNKGKWQECDRLIPGMMDSLKHDLSTNSKASVGIMAHPVTKFPMPQGVMIDVGTNIGSCTFMMSSIGHRIYSFEPLQDNLELISHSLQLMSLEQRDRITVIPAGVSDRRLENVPIYKDKVNRGNNIVPQPGGNPKAGTVNDTMTKNLDRETIQIVKLDDYVQEHVHLLKMDCQGCEYRALLGAKVLFKKYGVDSIFTEYAPDWIRNVGDEAIKLLELMDEYGFHVFSEGKSIPREKFIEFDQEFPPGKYRYVDLIAIPKKRIHEWNV